MRFSVRDFHARRYAALAHARIIRLALCSSFCRFEAMPLPVFVLHQRGLARDNIENFELLQIALSRLQTKAIFSVDRKSAAPCLDAFAELGQLVLRLDGRGGRHATEHCKSRCYPATSEASSLFN